MVNKDEYITAVWWCLVFDRFTHCTVDGLSPSHDYQFRVIAENFYGRSDPCEPTSLVQTVTEQEGRRKKGLGDTDGRSTLTCLHLRTNLFHTSSEEISSGMQYIISCQLVSCGFD